MLDEIERIEDTGVEKIHQEQERRRTTMRSSSSITSCSASVMNSYESINRDVGIHNGTDEEETRDHDYHHRHHSHHRDDDDDDDDDDDEGFVRDDCGQQVQEWNDSTTTTIAATNNETNTDDAGPLSATTVEPTAATDFLSSFPTFFDILDAILLFSCFRGVTIPAADRSFHSSLVDGGISAATAAASAATAVTGNATTEVITIAGSTGNDGGPMVGLIGNGPSHDVGRGYNGMVVGGGNRRRRRYVSVRVEATVLQYEDNNNNDSSNLHELSGRSRRSYGNNRRMDMDDNSIMSLSIASLDGDDSYGGAGDDTIHSQASNKRRRLPFFDDIDAKLSASHFVGVVDDIDSNGYDNDENKDDGQRSDDNKHIETPNGNVKIGTLVTSLKRIGTTSRIVNLLPSDLISLSRFHDLDAGEIAAIMKTYLPAFGALFHGVPPKSRPQRLTSFPDFFQDRNVLISYGNDIDVEAVIRLALLAGAHRVYVLEAPHNSRGTRPSLLNKFTSPRVVFMEGNDQDLHETILYKSMDVILDLGYLRNLDLLKNALSPRGRLVCVERHTYRPKNNVSRLKNIVGQASLMKMKRTCIYNFDDMCKNTYSEIVQDLEFLLNLTQKRKLRPLVDKYIKARDVTVIMDDMRRHPPRGAVICEPWRGYPNSDSITQFQREWTNTSLWIQNMAIRDDENTSWSSIDGRAISCL